MHRTDGGLSALVKPPLADVRRCSVFNPAHLRSAFPCCILITSYAALRIYHNISRPAYLSSADRRYILVTSDPKPDIDLPSCYLPPLTCNALQFQAFISVSLILPVDFKLILYAASLFRVERIAFPLQFHG